MQSSAQLPDRSRRDCSVFSRPATLRPFLEFPLARSLQRRMDLAPQSPMKLSRQIVEHPFGTIKAWMGHTHFLMKRLPNVKTEISLHPLAYNLKRVMQILGTASLIAAIQA